MAAILIRRQDCRNWALLCRRHPQPVANYVNGVRTGNLIFLAGKGPKTADGSEIIGKLGAGVTIEQGYEGARLTAINQLAVLKAMLGDLKKVKRIVKVLGMVNSDPTFVEQPKVINGFSDLWSRSSETRQACACRRGYGLFAERPGGRDRDDRRG